MLVVFLSAPARGQVPDTDIWVADLRIDGDSIRVGPPRNTTHRPGYDNQPCFVTDGKVFLFSSADSSGRTDVFRWEEAGPRIVRVTATPESEYSPTPLEAPRHGFCAVRVEADSTQRLWQFDVDGAHPRPVMSDVDSIGYFAWIDDNHLAAFILGNERRGEPHTLRVIEVSSQRETIVARGIGRAIHRIPGGKDVSFVALDPDTSYRFFVLPYGATRAAPLIDAVGEGQDAAWLGDTLLMASGTAIYASQPRRADHAWHAVVDVSSAGITTVTRIAVAPDRTRIAFVAVSDTH